MTKVMTEMTERVMYAVEGDPLSDVWASMQALGVRHIPVLREGKVIGILSDRDFLFIGRPGRNGAVHLPLKAVEDVMTREVVTCCIHDTIGRIADIMVQDKIDALPVVTPEKRLVGIITSTDLLRLLKTSEGELSRELPLKWETRPLLAEKAWRPCAP